MDKRRSRFVPGLSFSQECLERRVVLSTAVGGSVANLAAQSGRNLATNTTLTVSAGTLGQPITFKATVRAPASAGSPTGTVAIVDHGTVLGTIALVPTASTNARFAYSQARAMMTQPPGGAAYYFGKHQVTAEFIPSGAASRSNGNGSFTVAQPAYTTLAGGVKVASIAPGSGPAIQSGQTARVMYTGYLAQSGKIFDDSLKDGGTPFAFKVGAGQVVPGFDAGTAGMQVGETRVILIPPAEGYGATPNGSIPANSTLVFVVTLESIS